MEKMTDEYCEKIFDVLVINNEKIRFNKLYNLLIKLGAKMSRPTFRAPESSRQKRNNSAA